MRAMIAMSGGVDSSVAALLTQNQGYDCIGATMKLFSNDDAMEEMDRPCCSLTDASDAARVAWSLGMPHYVFDFTERFRRDVIGRFVASYESGLTPSPCIDCNTYLKFGSLLDRMRSIEADILVTGHYAVSAYSEQFGRYILKKAVDQTKDQTYFLYTMTQAELAHISFPLGELTKPQVRELAAASGFVNANKKESQDICFVTKSGYADFIENFTGRESVPGNFVSPSGQKLGQHKGIINYTVGQRKGLGIAMGRPVFVAEIRPDTNEVVLADEPMIFSKSCIIDEVNLIAYDSITEPIHAEVKVRSSAHPARALVSPISEGAGVCDGKLGVSSQTGQCKSGEGYVSGRVQLKIEFEEPQRAIAKGQAAVMYNGDIVIGGGRIV